MTWFGVQLFKVSNPPTTDTTPYRLTGQQTLVRCFSLRRFRKPLPPLALGVGASPPCDLRRLPFFLCFRCKSGLKFFMGKNNSVATTSGDTLLLDSSIQQRRRASEEEEEEEELEEEGLRKKGKMAAGTSAIVNNITGTIPPAAENNGGSHVRVPLSEVVGDCVKRWFKDTLREAKDGDINMQILVGQMYNSGYGVPRDTQKGKLWMTRASRVRASAWKVSQKQPGYNVSDSDSEEMKDDS